MNVKIGIYAYRNFEMALKDKNSEPSLFAEFNNNQSVIVRKSLLYQSKLGFYCINPVQGCSHGCRYPCYAWMMAGSHGRIKNYQEWCSPKIVINAYELLHRELTKLKSKPRQIHLCLSTDPFMYGINEIHALSLRLIGLINSFGISCSVLTKGKLPEELADTTKYSKENLYGISLISLDENFRINWEPGSSPYSERIESLKYLHEKGCHTRVHMEPYPIPELIEQRLDVILDKIQFVDEIFLGRWNYNKRVQTNEKNTVFYDEQFSLAGKYCHSKNIRFSSTSGK